MAEGSNFIIITLYRLRYKVKQLYLYRKRYKYY